MTVTALDLRGDKVACAVVENRGGKGVLAHAEVIDLVDIASFTFPGTIVMVAEAEACYRHSLALPPGTVIPNHGRYAAIASADAERPGGKRQGGAVEVHERHAVVALTNLDKLDATRKRMTDLIGQPVGTVDPAAAWLAFFLSQDQDAPELIVDDWNDPAQLIHISQDGSWISCEVEVIPPGTAAQRASVVAQIVQSTILSRRAIQQLAVFGRMSEHLADLIARLGGVIDRIEPLALETWSLAAGAALVGANFFTESYEEISL